MQDDGRTGSLEYVHETEKACRKIWNLRVGAGPEGFGSRVPTPQQ